MADIGTVTVFAMAIPVIEETIVVHDILERAKRVSAIQGPLNVLDKTVS